MATVTKTANVSKQLTLPQLAAEIECNLENEYYYSSQGLRNTIEDLKKRVNRAVPGKQRDTAKSDLSDQEIVLAMSELIESIPSILRRLFIADQLKQDAESCKDQLEEEIFTLPNMVNDNLPREVTIEIQGDVVPTMIIFHEQHVEMKLHSYQDGNATYHLV